MPHEQPPPFSKTKINLLSVKPNTMHKKEWEAFKHKTEEGGVFESTEVSALESCGAISGDQWHLNSTVGLAVPLFLEERVPW